MEIESFLKRNTLFDKRYQLIEPLSSDGGSADVWLALDTNTIDEVYDAEADSIVKQEDSGIKVAIKIYRPKNALDIGEQFFRDEFKKVFDCHHTNLVQPINFSVFEGTPYLVLPYCANGSSERLRGKMTEADDLWRYIRDVSSGLHYLHSFYPIIVHHDIKPANILIDNFGNFAITDFGISSYRGDSQGEYDSPQSGTMAYMAPERFQEGYDSMPESDIWSFGATVYELITGETPFGESGGQAQITGESSIPKIKQDVPRPIKKLVYDCLSIDPAKRPSAETIHNTFLVRHHNQPRIMIILAIVSLLLMGLIARILLFPPEEEEPLTPLSTEDIYQQALTLLDDENRDSLEKGMVVMDSLCSSGYVPAIYEMARTYGWYKDSISLQRKALLDIEVYEEKARHQWLPKSNTINIKAVSYFSQIEERNDSAYPHINADVLYRLACYYGNTDKVFSRNLDRAIELLQKAGYWAQRCNDAQIQEAINIGITRLNKEKQKQKENEK